MRTSNFFFRIVQLRSFGQAAVSDCREPNNTLSNVRSLDNWPMHEPAARLEANTVRVQIV